MSAINIRLSENRDVSHDEVCFGSEYENEVTVLQFIFPETINEVATSTFTKYIEFKENTKSKAEEDKAKFYDLLTANDDYTISNAITFYKSMLVQIVLRKTIDPVTNETMVWKSKVFTISFCDSINASDVIDPEDPQVALIQQLVDEVTEASEIVENLNTEITDDELTRTQNETTRQSNELTRQSNENTRQTNETARNLFEAFDNTKIYVVNNKVAYQGSSYVCIAITTAGTLPTDTSHWLLIAQKGETGSAGTNGQNGADGQDGADGADGQDGYTPVKGTDYWTTEDQADIVSDAVSQINIEIGLELDLINGEVI